MCLLTFYKPGIMPNVEELRNGSFMNDDGHGYAIVVNGQIVVGKSMDASALIAEFAEIRAKHPEGPAMFHSRFATAGVCTTFNCHPFYLSSDKQTVMAHNGVFEQKYQPSKKDARSDTRIVADEVFGWTKFGPWWTKKGIKQYSQWMTPYNKVVILTVNPRYHHSFYMFNEQSGHYTEEGIWYSNTGYQPYVYHVNTDTYNHTLGTSLYDKWRSGNKWSNADCLICDAKESVDPVVSVCGVCNACQDCLSDVTSDCQCYMAFSTTSPDKDDDSDNEENLTGRYVSYHNGRFTEGYTSTTPWWQCAVCGKDKEWDCACNGEPKIKNDHIVVDGQEYRVSYDTDGMRWIDFHGTWRPLTSILTELSGTTNTEPSDTSVLTSDSESADV
jgi:glutamine amidotransferase